MKKILKPLGFLLIMAIFAFVVACEDLADLLNNDPEDTEETKEAEDPAEDPDEQAKTEEEKSKLPESAGNNELAGKTFINGYLTINFSADGSYTLYIKNKNDKPELSEEGFYSWNTPEKTVSLMIYKSDTDLGFLSKSESRELYIEHFNSLNAEQLEETGIPPDMSIEDYVDMVLDFYHSPAEYEYIIENGLITHLIVKIKSLDTGDTIADCAYSQKAVTESLGVHYLLSITYDEALIILTDLYGQPIDGWSLQSFSEISEDKSSWVIIELTRFGDMRLHKEPAAGTFKYSTKGWIIIRQL